MVQNIPTELLRAFVTVIDLKGFTRAGEFLGRSQPAISLQIKRLQDQIGYPLFSRDNGGAGVTECGRMVESYARRMLALNDELVEKITSRNHRGRFRLGLPYELAESLLDDLLSSRWARDAKLSFEVTCDTASNLLVGLRDGAYDLVFAISEPQPIEGLTKSWQEPLVWVGNPELAASREQPLRLICFAGPCQYRNQMQVQLTKAGRPFEVIYTCQSYEGIQVALRSGFGITALPARAVHTAHTVLDRTSGLPPLSDLTGGIYLGGALSGSEVAPLAARLAEVLSERQREVA